jgi:ATP-dependent RNA helicase RhlE
MSFDELGLRPELLRAVAKAGYTEPTPIQSQAIPLVLQGRDVMAGAQTGTGKTAGFVLPILQRLTAGGPPTGRGRRMIRALIVTPTRELAAQVEESIREYGRFLPVRSAVVYGGVGMRGQLDALARGVDILVATPGRLLDHSERRSVDLSAVETVVLDEADRMLDMGFLPDIRRVLKLLPTQRQSLLFSATYTDEVRGLASGLLRDPATVEAPRETVESDLVEQCVYPATKEGKKALLVHLLGNEVGAGALVFVRTRHGADKLAKHLDHSGINAVPIHGSLSQNQRIRSLGDFKAGRARVLVATDIAARGLDIDQLPHVINFDLPNVPEDYVHRIGRTGRAGTQGAAISLVCGEEIPFLQQIEKLVNKRLPRVRVDGMEEHTPSGSLEHWGAPREYAPRPAQSQANKPARRRGPERVALQERFTALRGSAGEPVAEVSSPRPPRRSRPEGVRPPDVDQSRAAMRGAR